MKLKSFLIIYNKLFTSKYTIQFLLYSFFFALIEILSISSTALFIQIVSNSNGISFLKSNLFITTHLPWIIKYLKNSTFIYFFIILISIRYITSIIYFNWIYFIIFNTQTRLNSIFSDLIFKQNYIELKAEEFQSTKNVFYKELDYYITYFIQPLLLLLPDLFQIIFLVSLLLIFLPSYSIIIILCMFFLVYLINKLVKKKVVAISHKLAIHQRSRTHIIENFYSNILFWKIKNLYEKLKSSFDQENTVLANNSASLNFLQQIPRTTFELFIFLIFSILALLNIDNTSQIFTSYIIMSLAALKLLPSAVKVSSFIQSALSSASITNSLNEILNNKSLKNKINSKIIIKNFENKYEFKNVSFRYKDRVILNECNFIFKKNEIISISGSSGAGKSTFLEIFLRLIDATSGKIFLDDQDITNTPIDFSRLIGIVPQSVEFINGTLRENLLLGINVHVSDEEIFKILSKCNLIELINKMPQSLETIIDNHSNFFSGGEKQRIAIARSLLDVDVKILIFDEITSALDKSNSIKLLENIMLFKHQYSIIFITHDDLIKNYCEKNYILENKTLNLLTK